MIFLALKMIKIALDFMRLSFIPFIKIYKNNKIKKGKNSINVLRLLSARFKIFRNRLT